MAGVGRALRKHVDEETAGYAADLGRKLQNKDGGLSTYPAEPTTPLSTEAASRPTDAPRAGPDARLPPHPAHLDPSPSDWHVMDACDPGREILLIGSRERAVAGARDP
jgi:hypothetical protein